jgi:hypothetical protein
MDSRRFLAPLSLTNHPLNQGRALWWAPVSNQQGSVWYDLTGSRRNATQLDNGLTNEWVQDVSGKFLAQRIYSGDANTNRLIKSAPVSLADMGITARGSVALWMFSRLPDGTRFVCSENTESLGGGNRDNASIAQVSTLYWTRWTNSSGTFGTVQAGAVQFGRWMRIASVYNGTDVRLYVNGRLTGTPAALTGTLNNTTGVRWQIGRRGQANTATPYDGYVTHGCLWSRALSADEAREDYELGLRGYDELVDQLIPRQKFSLLFAPQPAPAFNPAWAAGVNRYIGGGIHAA